MTTTGGLPSLLDEILTGLEEEGIPAEHQEVTLGPAVILAKSACLASRLNVGIGVDWEESRAALTHRDLPPETPLFVLTGETFTPAGLRRLGVNAARLVKGNPLLFEDAKPDSPKARAAPRTGPVVSPKPASRPRTGPRPWMNSWPLILAEIRNLNQGTSG